MLDAEDICDSDAPILVEIHRCFERNSCLASLNMEETYEKIPLNVSHAKRINVT